MIKWAEDEVSIVKQNNKDEYYSMCLDAALEVYEMLCKQGHSGYSIAVTEQILHRLIEREPLSPIEDVPDVWNEVADRKYQCNRYSGLFKDVIDASAQYTDVNRFVCHEVDNPNIPFHSGLVTRTLDKMFPIVFPYFPEKVKVTVHESLINPNNGDFDTVHIIRAKFPDGTERVIHRYFTEKNDNFVEITKSEYDELFKAKEADNDQS